MTKTELLAEVERQRGRADLLLHAAQDALALLECGKTHAAAQRLRRVAGPSAPVVRLAPTDGTTRQPGGTAA